MNACKRFPFTLSLSPIAQLLAGLFATACVIVPSDDHSANRRVSHVVVVGTSVSSALYETGELGVTMVPTSDDDETVLAKDLDVRIVITAPIQLEVSVSTTECTEPDQGKKAISVGVIIDDSGSMDDNDPNLLRKDATVSFLKALGADDKVLLTDYGHATDESPLRDLLCTSKAKAGSPSDTGDGADPCTSVKPSFSGDKAALIGAASEIASGGGTPLYDSCLQMVPLVDSVKDGRRGMLLLSDGRPDSSSKREACHSAAKAAHIPVFTVGLGPAAEGNELVDGEAVKVLRDLATESGGGYASADAPAQLDSLFRNMGTALARGSCKTTARITTVSAITPGARVKGEITVGSHSATAPFEFVAPPR